jgi:hypothetical protein
MQVTPVFEIDGQQLTNTPVTWYVPVEFPDELTEYMLNRPETYVTQYVPVRLTNTAATNVMLSFRAEFMKERDDLAPDRVVDES